MPASRFLKIVQETGQIPLCSFYLPVSTSRNHPVGAHTDNFVIACANRQVLNALRARFLDAFEGTYEGDLRRYLGCEVSRYMDKGTVCVPDSLCRGCHVHLQFLECNSSSHPNAAKHASL